MAFAKKKTVDEDFDIEKEFIPSDELVRMSGCKLGLVADAGVGKTHLACTAKKPIYFIDTENTARMISKNFPPEVQKDIKILEVRKYSVHKGSDEKINYGESLAATMRAINFLEKKISEMPDGEEGTIVIDSASDVWEWLNQWLLDQKDLKFTSSGYMMQTEYGKRNKRWVDFLETLRNCKWHVVLTFKARALYDDRGKKTDEITGIWHQDTKYAWNNIGELRPDGKGGNCFILVKTRDGKLPNQSEDIVMNPTWDSIIKMLEDRSGVKYV